MLILTINICKCIYKYIRDLGTLVGEIGVFREFTTGGSCVARTARYSYVLRPRSSASKGLVAALLRANWLVL